MSESKSVCVVTHPLGSAGESATESLLDILTAIRSVSLVVPGLATDSGLRTRDDLIATVDVSVGEPADCIPVAAVQFVLHQLRLSAAIYRRNESVVLFYGSTAYLLPIITATLLGRTVILQPRGDVPLTLRLHWEQRVPKIVARLLAGMVRLLEWIGYWLSDAIITYTPSMADELGLDRFAKKVYSQGARYVDTETFYPRVPFAKRESVVGFVGRLDEEKNVRMLATVAKQLPQEVQFRFVGDGELRAELERNLSEEINQGAVEFTGWVDHENVPAVLNRFQLLVMPSQPTEGLPTVILEAFACGTPVYATPVAGVPDVVRRGETGFRIDELDSETIAAEVKRILAEEDFETLSQNARALIESEYSFEGAVERYTRILTAISEEKQT